MRCRLGGRAAEARGSITSLVALRRRRLTVLVAALVAVAATLTVGPGDTPAAPAAATPAQEPACFGAAARDVRTRCSHPTLSVFPTMEDVDADFVPGSPCDPVRGDPAPICAFGVARSQAKRHFALIGDSHALHWRRAVDVVALAERWRGYSLTTAACPFSAAVAKLPQGLRAHCEAWYRAALAWLRDHPEVSTVFTSSFAPLPVVVNGTPSGGGKAVAAVKARGVRRAWRALPRSVKHVIVIRDNPLTTQDQFDCVQRVSAQATRSAGAACAAGRGALRWDVAASTAKSLRSTRIQHVDLSEFFCDARWCHPVIGGARVFRDAFGHITTAYSRTLGPFLHRKLRALMRRW